MQEQENERQGLFLEWIELENFLSFKKARISFTLNDGSVSKFSIITGPNGAGKSSVFQALKYVLGSNSKDGRYAKWDGFIHHGADFMRVKVGFHAIDGTVYEIARLSRKGQGSDFYLNGKHVNATTIYALVKELRIFPDNIFSFVAQGHVNAIKDLSAKEIYGLIETGMGIAGLRKEIEGNAGRIEEINAQLQNLKIEKDTCTKQERILAGKMEKLREKRKLEDELVRFRAERSWAQKNDILQRIDEKRQEKAYHETSQREFSMDRDARKERVIELRGQMERLEEELGTSNEQLTVLKVNQATLEDETKKWDKKKQELGKKNDEMKHAKEVAAQVFADLATQLKDASYEKERLEGLAASLSIKQTELQGRLDTIGSELEKNEDWIDQHEQVKRALDQEVKTKKTNEQLLEVNEAAIEDVLDDIKELTSTLQQYNWDSKADAKIDLNARIAEEVSSLDAEIKAKKDQLLLKKKDEAELRKQTGIMQGPAEEERRTLKEVEMLKQEIKRSNLEEHIKGPIYEFMQYDPAHARAIEAQFKKYGLLGFVAFSDENFNLVNSLRKKFKVPATIYQPHQEMAHVKAKPSVNFPGVVDYLNKLIKVPSWLRAIVDHIARDTIVVETFSDAVKLIKMDNRARCVTLDGIIVEGKEGLTESSPPYYGAPILGPQHADDDVAGLQMRLNMLVKENTGLESQIEALHKQKKDKETRQQELAKIGIYLKQKEAKSKKKAQYLAKKDEIKNAIIDNDLAISTLSQQLAELEAQKPKAILTLTSELSETKADLADVQSKLEGTNSDLQQASTIISELDVKHDDAAKELDEITAEYEQLKAEIKSNAVEVKEFNEKRDAIKKQMKEISTTIASTSQQKVELLQSIEEEDNAINNIEVRIKVLDMEAEKITQDIVGLEREQAYIDLNLKDMVKPDQLKTIEEYDVILEKLSKKLASLEFLYITNEIEKEYEQNCQIIETLTGKMDELEEELSRVQYIGDDLKTDYLEKMTRNVKELEKRINDKFSDLSIPFHAVLDASGDFQEPRIDMSVDFFGQASVPLAAVSEGQKSIIALGLMLTLQDLNPGPICVFDEAHIYLDESNKEIISKLIRKTCEKIQLIMLVPTTSHGFVKSADKIIAVVRQGIKFADGNAEGKEQHQLGPSRIIEVNEQEFTQMLDAS
ncbi:MAG TPA: AAA family ATPase [Candidatus Lokiarchaeia archaeon]|nr:AAA family ATPase [Candidatus Lokiarchaeia archaeon]